jgi:phosphoribosylformylglycinamidine cyclo-ligase
MPDVIDGKGDKAFDLVGMVLGIVNKKQVITGNQIKKGDIIIGAESSGIHSNGYSLIRKLLLSKYKIEEQVGLDESLGEELLKPTQIYVKPILEILRKIRPSGLAHITGGGFSKLTRLVKARNLGFKIDNIPKPLPIFTLIQDEGKISNLEMYRTFNMGIGFCIIASSVDSDKIQKIFKQHRINSTKIGEIIKDPGVFIGELKID